MKLLQTGQFYGQTNNTFLLNGLALTDTEYTQEKVDWHYHENAYFTFILQGNIIEGNKKEVNKPGLFFCMGLYIVYTFIEVSGLMKVNKQKTNA